MLLGTGISSKYNNEATCTSDFKYLLAAIFSRYYVTHIEHIITEAYGRTVLLLILLYRLFFQVLSKFLT
jgi:hypothetical protein